MTKSTKAALLSGLIFPGIGHFVLKCYLRGSLLMLPALTAMSAITKIAYQHAQAIVDRVISGEASLEAGAISELLANSSNDSDSLISNISMLAFLECWLFRIVDSYRIGNRLEEWSGA